MALALLLLMTVAVATSQHGLRFCLCLGTASFGECACLSDSRVADDGAPGGSDSCPCSGEGELGGAMLDSCENCFVELFIDLDEFTDVTARDAAGKSFHKPAPCFSVVLDTNVLPPARRADFDEARGSPPPPAEIASAPLRVRYSVFLV